MGGTGESIIPLAGSSVVPNSYFVFTSSNNLKYYVWYNLNSAGIDPAPSGGYTMGIPVIYTTTMTAAQVASATQLAINSVYFAVPNFQGLFLRGYDPNIIWDLDAASRYSLDGANYGNNLGTFEYDAFLSHTHTGTGPGANDGPTPPTFNSASATSSAPGGTFPLTILNSGLAETRPVNANVVWIVKY